MLIRGLIAVAVAGAVMSPAYAQGAALFGPGAPPATIKLKDLGPAWQSLRVSGPPELKGGGGASQLAGGFLGMMFGGGAPTSSYSPPQFTQGATATLGGETFLILYRQDAKGLDLTALMKMGNPLAGGGEPELPLPEKLTPETPLILTLINVRSISTITSIRPFNLQQEIAESAKAAADEARFLEQLKQGPGGGLPGAGLGLGIPEADTAPDIAAPAKPSTKPAPKKPAPKGSGSKQP